MEFTMKIEGILEVTKALQDLGAQAEPAMRAALLDEGNALRDEADKLVPVDTSQLINSGFTKAVQGSTPEVDVGYGGAAAPYAVVVHENPRSGKTGGLSPSGKPYKRWAKVGQWKYLEKPFKERVAGFTDRIAASLRMRLLKER